MPKTGALMITPYDHQSVALGQFCFFDDIGGAQAQTLKLVVNSQKLGQANGALLFERPLICLCKSQDCTSNLHMSLFPEQDSAEERLEAE